MSDASSTHGTFHLFSGAERAASLTAEFPPAAVLAESVLFRLRRLVQHSHVEHESAVRMHDTIYASTACNVGTMVHTESGWVSVPDPAACLIFFSPRSQSSLFFSWTIIALVSASVAAGLFPQPKLRRKERTDVITMCTRFNPKSPAATMFIFLSPSARAVERDEVVVVFTLGLS